MLTYSKYNLSEDIKFPYMSIKSSNIVLVHTPITLTAVQMECYR